MAAAAPGADAAGRHAYVANDLNNKISQFQVTSGGRLAPLSPATRTLAAGANAFSFSFTPDGGSLFVTAGAPPAVAQFTIGPGGDLIQKSPAGVTAGPNPFGIAVSPDGRSAYATRTRLAPADVNEVWQYDVAADGRLSAKSPQTVSVPVDSPHDIALTPDGRNAYVSLYENSAVAQYTVGAGGQLTPKVPATVPAGSGTNSIKVSPDGRSVYVSNFGAGNIRQYTVGAGGALVPKTPATVPASASAGEIEISPDGRNVYMTSQAGPTGFIFQYTAAPDGTLAAKNPASVPANHFGTRGLAMSPDGASLYASNSAANTVSQYTIGAGGLLTPKNPATVATSGSQAGDIAMDPNQGPAAGFATGPAYAGRATQFNAGSSRDPDGAVAGFAWDFGDGTGATGAAPAHTYARTGTYTVTLRATDDEGCSTGSVFTGHQFLCNGNPAAVLTQAVRVTVAPPALRRCFGKRVTKVARAGRRTVGTKRADVILGTSKGDRIDGRGGKDVICAGSGKDRIKGGSGNDRIGGGKGADRLSGDSGNDALAGDSGNDRISGGAGKDTLKGGAGKDVLGGGPGRDRLFGNAGKDKLAGGPGRDRQKQ